MKLNKITEKVCANVAKIDCVGSHYHLKRAFTMIELVFVIVILGILASIAIPKLVATKDDAIAVKAAQEIGNVITELTAFYTAKGQFVYSAGRYAGQPLSANPEIGDPTNVLWKDMFQNMTPTMIDVYNRRNLEGDANNWAKKCIDIWISNTTASIRILPKSQPRAADPEGKPALNSNYCKTLFQVPAVANWIKMSDPEGKGATLANGKDTTHPDWGIKIGGTTIFTESKPKPAPATK